jgi:hypothetical protein
MFVWEWCNLENALYNSLDELFQRGRYFIDSISNYKKQIFICLYSLGILMVPWWRNLNTWVGQEAMEQWLSIPTEWDKFSEYAVAYNVNINAGGMPLWQYFKKCRLCLVIEMGKVKDVCEKLHITPWWGKVLGGLKIGNTLQTYDAFRKNWRANLWCGFPNSRVVGRRGVQICCSLSLNTQLTCWVPACTQARAIENKMFCSYTGGIGILQNRKFEIFNIPNLAVFTPSDFCFPSNAG